jgi:cytochrome c oxidase assembly factor CtaG
MNLVLSHWSANLAVLAAWLVVAAAHLSGVRGLAADFRRRGEAVPDYLAREALIFQTGLATAALAFVSPVGYWSQRIIWVRSLQDLLLANVAPALIVIGAPWLALRRSVRPRGGVPVTGPTDRGAEVAAQAAAGWPLPSVLAIAAFIVGWCVWHLAGPYDAALAHPLIYAAEAVTYLGLGIAFWLQLVGSRPYVPRLSALRRVMALIATITVSTVLAMVLVFSYQIAYYSYVTGPHQTVSVLSDQQAAGAVLWVLMLPSYVIAGIALLIRWLHEEDANAVGTGIDRLLKPAKPAKSAWPSRPGLR